MPTWLWWTLLTSVFVALIVMAVAFFIMRSRIKKIKTEIKPASEAEIETSTKAVENPFHGKILVAEKQKSTNPLEDEEVVFVVNTLVRNSYKKLCLVHFGEYEANSFKQLAGVSIEKQGPFDLVLIRMNEEIASEVPKFYPSLRKGGMLVIAEAEQKTKPFKALISDLKFLKRRYEFMPLGIGVVLIVK